MVYRRRVRWLASNVEGWDVGSSVSALGFEAVRAPTYLCASGTGPVPDRRYSLDQCLPGHSTFNCRLSRYSRIPPTAAQGSHACLPCMGNSGRDGCLFRIPWRTSQPAPPRAPGLKSRGAIEGAIWYLPSWSVVCPSTTQISDLPATVFVRWVRRTGPLGSRRRGAENRSAAAVECAYGLQRRTEDGGGLACFFRGAPAEAPKRCADVNS